ncbi:uncharacterized protein LOC116845169 [Odontomachus brunneus]|uniref:uncharacterized protein LOC116845169 n=1 Tax=Odontomachus brunneus TaxID=486640 RepID=UPI0013F2AC6E|nr:uncharacterized protein LOC116845169 [Odontomachus brunneus]
MLILPMIPFFLGYVAQNESNHTPTYIFHVRIDTLLNNHSKTDNKESNAGLEFNLKCQPHENENLKCHIPKTISYSPSTDPIHMVDNNVFTPSSLQFNRIRYRMSFDFKGVTDYQFLTENVTNKEALLEIYQFIGDQLSVGVNLKKKEFVFNATENTIIGQCPTLYKLNQDVMYNRKSFKLISLIANHRYRLNENESFHISKQRRVNECQSQKSYIFGRSLWIDFITSNVTAKPKDSGTLMSYNQHDFYTKTINTFDLYNEQDNKVGYLYETINVRLESVKK